MGDNDTEDEYNKLKVKYLNLKNKSNKLCDHFKNIREEKMKIENELIEKDKDFFEKLRSLNDKIGILEISLYNMKDNYEKEIIKKDLEIKKFKNILHQLHISNQLSIDSGFDK
ncbi:hypothetical protein DLAC_09641 [Tieghemostelium lacteum]|uniref:Uncharacterized protein n=1 Tax=Tieghemostelium lacteum TaxID=361077 RepID=A0A151Z6W0_TIELA|nr:hypothetical protein DLAC_09641 [Tieghemostelium lacteum]|eukprot:KYQ89675.1 hypothetical protein DLAC_09641 [Tieghemostelium lacteum]